MSKKRNIKKSTIKFFSFVIIFLVIGISIIKYIEYRNSYKFKFKKLGYNENQIKKLETLSIETKDYILTLKKNNYIIKLMDQKYFIESNLKKYLKYQKTLKKDINNTIAIVNVGSNNDWYTNTKKTDINLNELMLTNKFYYLDESYNSDKMVKVSNIYSYGTNQMLTEDTYILTINLAKEKNMQIILLPMQDFQNIKQVWL